MRALLVAGFYGLVTLFFFRPVLLDNAHLSTVPSLQQFYFPWQVTDQQGLDLPPQADEAETFFPRQVFVDRLVHDGQLPTWDPYTFAGHPYLSNGATTFFYPVRQLVTWLADPALAHDLYLMLHMFGAGCAMYLLCRELRVSTPAALLAGLAWMWNPYLLAWMQLELGLAVLVWLPAALALVHRAHRARSRPALAGAALALAAMLLGGTLDQATGAVALVGAYGLALEVDRLRRERRDDRREQRLEAARAVGRMALLGALGVAVGMVSYLPFVLLSGRIARAPIPYDTFLHEVAVPLRAFPKLLWPLSTPITVAQMHQMTFVGTLVVVLAAVGTFSRRAGAGLARTLVVGSIVVLAATPLTHVFDALTSQYRYISPGRFLWAWALGLIVLAAFGLDRLLGLLDGRRLAAGALVAVALAGTGAQLYRYGRSINQPFTPRVAKYQYPATPVISHIEALGARPAGDRNLPVHIPGQGRPADASIPAVFPFESAAGYDSALPRWIADLWRVVGGEQPSTVSAHPLSQGLISLFPTDAVRTDLLARVGVTSVLTAPNVADAPGWDAAGVAAKGLRPDYAGADGRVLLVDGAAPRAYVVHRAEQAGDAAVELARFTDPAFPWQTSVLLDGAPSDTGDAATPMQPATVTEHDIDAVTVEVHSDGPGWLVLLDSYDDGWTATVDGHAEPVTRANVAFRAVAVPAGDSVVRFRYATPGLDAGAALTALGLAGVTALAVSDRFSPRGLGRFRPRRAGA